MYLHPEVRKLFTIRLKDSAALLLGLGWGGLLLLYLTHWIRLSSRSFLPVSPYLKKNDLKTKFCTFVGIIVS